MTRKITLPLQMRQVEVEINIRVLDAFDVVQQLKLNIAFLSVLVLSVVDETRTLSVMSNISSLHIAFSANLRSLSVSCSRWAREPDLSNGRTCGPLMSKLVRITMRSSCESQ